MSKKLGAKSRKPSLKTPSKTKSIPRFKDIGVGMGAYPLRNDGAFPHVTKYCKHPAAYMFEDGIIREGWCKLCRMNATGHSSEEIAKEASPRAARR